jgi:predicted extracellular nuclease
MIPASVSIPANAVSATFSLTADAMAMGMATIGASLNAASFSSTVTVTALPVTNHIVISEFASRGTASAFDEFVELYNPTAAAIDISGWKLQTKSATATTWTDRVIFPGNTSLAPRRFWLTANTTGTPAGGSYVSPASGPVPDSSWLGGASGVGDTGGGIRLVQTVNQMDVVVDAVAFGTGSTQGEGAPLAALPGTAMAAASFERKAKMSSTAASMTGAGADALQGNSYDTDVNVDNFVLRPTRDAQSNQSPAEP